jgi:hypothetical protein
VRLYHWIPMRSTPLFALTCLAAGCDPARSTGSAEQPDSIVLERTQCTDGTCPAYLLSLTRSGAIHFRSLDPGDARTATDVLPHNAFGRLAQRAEELNFDALPETMIGTQFCTARATDFPSAIVTIFRTAYVKRVVDYQGCFPGPTALRRFAQAIDSTAVSERWVGNALSR